MVTTGTGSGKTECFLLPILGKLAREAADTGRTFRTNTAMRAMVLYPMNALVNDQLGRLRLLFGDRRIMDKIHALVRSSSAVCEVHKSHALSRSAHECKGPRTACANREVLR